MSSVPPEKFDSAPIVKFLKNGDDTLVIRTRRDDSGKYVRELKSVPKSELTFLETAADFLGLGTRRIFKQLIREGALRTELIAELNRRLAGQFGWGKVTSDKLQLAIENVVGGHGDEVNQSYQAAFIKGGRFHVLAILELGIYPPVTLPVGEYGSPLEFAYNAGWAEVVGKLLNQTEYDYQLKNRLLVQASQQNPLDRDMVRALIAGGSDLYAFLKGPNPLRALITHKDREGAAEVIGWMIHTGKNINDLYDPASQVNKPAFYFSQEDGIGTLLLEYQARKEAKPREVIAARTEGALPIIKKLFPNYDAFRNAGLFAAYAIQTAVISKNSEAIEYLLGLDCQQEVVEKRMVRIRTAAREAGDSVLHLTDNINVVTKLIEAGADVNAHVPRVGTALHKAASKGDLAMMELLLDKGARADIDLPFVGTPLKRLLKNTLTDMQAMMAEKLLSLEAEEREVSKLELAANYSKEIAESRFLITTICQELQETFEKNSGDIQNEVDMLSDKTLEACLERVRQGPLSDYLKSEYERR